MAARPGEVEKAVNVLLRSEAVPDHEKRAKQIKEAFDFLDAYLKENPASEHREYVEKCKRSYLRSHLMRLSSVDEPDQEMWLFNFILFAGSHREVAQVLEQHPELRSWYDRFMFMRSYLEWAGLELLPHLERMKK